MTTENLYRRLNNVRTVVRIWMDAHPGQSLPDDIYSNLTDAEDGYRESVERKNGSDR